MRPDDRLDEAVGTLLWPECRYEQCYDVVLGGAELAADGLSAAACRRRRYSIRDHASPVRREAETAQRSERAFADRHAAVHARRDQADEQPAMERAWDAGAAVLGRNVAGVGPNGDQLPDHLRVDARREHDVRAEP